MGRGVFSLEDGEMGHVRVHVGVMCPQVCECVTACTHSCLGVRVCVELTCVTERGAGEKRVESWVEGEAGEGEGCRDGKNREGHTWRKGEGRHRGSGVRT